MSFEESIQWNKTNSTCNTSSVVVRNEDSHIISALLSARVSKMAVRIYADDRFKIESECVVRAIGF